MPLPSQRGPVAAAGDPAVFSIVAVCTGNLCRSPALEQLLRHRLPDALPGIRFSVASAGTYALPGQPMDSAAAREVERLGVSDAAGHRTQRLTAGLVKDADLVLALAKEHRRAAVQLAPEANGRAFTTLEFAHIVDTLEPASPPPDSSGPDTLEARLRSVVESAHRTRGRAARGQGDLDVVDPYQGGAAVHRASAESIDAAVARILTAWINLTRPGN